MQIIKLLCALIFLFGCAINTVYDPVASSTTGQSFVLNEAALKNVRVGMTQTEVHAIMGDAITIGYSYATVESKGAEPITINNPFKIERVTKSQGQCDVEYYATAVHRADGALSDDELAPLTFCNGVLVSKDKD